MSWKNRIKKERLSPKLDESKLPEGHWRKGEGLRRKATKNIEDFFEDGKMIWKLTNIVENESFEAEEYKELLNALISLSDFAQLRPKYDIKPFNKGGLLQILNSMGELE